MKSLSVPMLYLFDDYPREKSTPYRAGVVRNRHEMFTFVNAHNGRTNVYLSCFAYAKLKDQTHPDYTSARIRHVPLDFDKEGPLTPNSTFETAVQEAFRVHNKLLDRGIEHAADLSGGGIHLFIRAVPEAPLRPAAALNGAQQWVEKALLGGIGASLDKMSFFGDPARVIRVPNTLNRNKSRWCIPLTARTFEDLAGGNGTMKEAAVRLAARPVEVSLEEYVYPGEPLDIAKWDSDLFLPIRSRYMDVHLSGEVPGGDVDTGIEVVVRNVAIAEIVHPQMNNAERGVVIMELMEEGYSEPEIIRFLREHLSPEKFSHCLYSERQVQRMYERFVRR